MNGLLWVVAASVVGVDAGWQPIPEGGVEYIIQINPESLPLMKPGFYFTSEVPSEVKDIRRYRITVGSDDLPKKLPPPKVETPAAPTSSFPPEPSANRPLPDMARWTPPPVNNTPHVLPAALEAEPIATAPSPAIEVPASPPSVAAESKPWLPFVLSLLFLFASLGANAYLGWMLIEQRTRYRSLLSELRPAELT